MQFNVTTQVFGINRTTMEGNTYCSLFVGQAPIDPQNTRLLEITKWSADPVVFDQLSSDIQPGDHVELIATMKRAAGGKSQPYVLGVVPKKTGSAAPAPAAAKS